MGGVYSLYINDSPLDVKIGVLNFRLVRDLLFRRKAMTNVESIL